MNNIEFTQISKKCGWPKKRLAEYLGVDARSIWNYENDPNKTIPVAIAKLMLLLK